MTNLILIAILITIISLFVLLRPLFMTRSTVSYERDTQNIHFAKERLAELEEQLKNATISATDYEALKLEIESTLAQDINLDANTMVNSSDTKQTSNKTLIALLCVLIPLGGFTVYSFTGTPEALTISQVSKQNGQQLPSKEEIDAMVSTIEQRLKDNPSDIEGWGIIARTYLALGRYQDAIDANLKLLELGGENANIYAQLADASALITQGDLSGQASEYINKALALNPNQPQALWLAGLGAAQRGETDQAIDYWNKLMPLLANSPQQQQELKEIISKTAENKAIAVELDTPSKAQAPKPVVTEKNKGPSITVRVTLAEAMRDQASAGETVFVFARAKNGPPAPLAVKPLRVADLPANVTLSDADAMMQQLKLSLFEEVVVSARIAKSGNPIAQSGDIQSDLIEIQTTNQPAKPIELVISHVVE